MRSGASDAGRSKRATGSCRRPAFVQHPTGRPNLATMRLRVAYGTSLTAIAGWCRSAAFAEPNRLCRTHPDTSCCRSLKYKLSRSRCRTRVIPWRIKSACSRRSLPRFFMSFVIVPERHVNLGELFAVAVVFSC